MFLAFLHSLGGMHWNHPYGTSDTIDIEDALKYVRLDYPTLTYRRTTLFETFIATISKHKNDLSIAFATQTNKQRCKVFVIGFRSNIICMGKL